MLVAVHLNILHLVQLPATIKVISQVLLIIVAQAVVLHQEATELLLLQNRVVATKVVLHQEVVAVVTVVVAVAHAVAAHHTQVVHPVAQEAQEVLQVHQVHLAEVLEAVVEGEDKKQKHQQTLFIHKKFMP